VSIDGGHALDLVFAPVGGRTTLRRRRYRWPLLIGRVFPDPNRPGVGMVIVQNAAGTVIPGDVVRQRIAVIDGGSVVVRGQGATLVSGIPRGEVAVEETTVRVDSHSHLLWHPSARILTAHARYRQRTQVCVEPGGRAVLVDAVVLHPDLTGDVFGSWESTVVVTAPDGALRALDAQLLEALPGMRDAPRAFGMIYVIGTELDTMMTALAPGLESLTVLTDGRRAYVGVSDLPNEAGWAVRVAASDGGALRTVIGEATTILETATRADALTCA
jgi:urease accessory protein